MLLGNRPAALALTIGVGIFAASVVADLVSAGKLIEEGLEGLAGLFFAAGIVLLMYTHLRDRLRVRMAVPSDDVIHASESPNPRPARARAPAGIAS